MIPHEKITYAIATIETEWGDDGKKVIECIFNVPHKPCSCNDFLSYCVAQGGNWGGMLLSGINNLYPSVYDAIPDALGCNAFNTICCVLTLLGVDTSA